MAHFPMQQPAFPKQIAHSRQSQMFPPLVPTHLAHDAAHAAIPAPLPYYATVKTIPKVLII